MAFKITLLSDVRSFLKGTEDIEKSLDGVADSLDQLATDTANNAAEAGAKLEREFTDAFDKVKTEAKTTSRKVGDDFQDGSHRASEGVSEMRDEVQGSAREMAASFDGSAQSITDLVQEIAANALPALGPAGAAAGIALALGLGAGLSALEQAKEKADQAKDKVLALADVLEEAKGNPELVNWAEQLRDTMKEIVDAKEWWEFWQAAPVDRLTAMNAQVEQFGLNRSNIVKAMTGDMTALSAVQDEINAKVAQQLQAYNDSMEIMSGQGDIAYKNNIESLTNLNNQIADQAKVVADATQWQQAYADATKEISDAQAVAAQASQTFSDSLTSNLSVADEGLDQFVTKGKLGLGKWADELNDRAKQNTRIKDFAIDVDTKLSPEALRNFEQLPIETQDLIAKAYKGGSSRDRKKVLANLEAEAKIDKVTVDTSSVKVAPVQIEATVLTDGAVKGTQEAADAAQREAARQTNRIEFDTHIDVADLQRQVNRAAASITPPTIYVNVQPRKVAP